MESVGKIKFNRVWAMPDRWTFKIAPIAKLVHRYVGDGIGWIDPFAGENSPAEITNDLNTSRPTVYHMQAIDFVNEKVTSAKGILFDPPYNLSQLKECYGELGIENVSLFETNYFPHNIKKAAAAKIETGGIAICFGWNSNGFGKSLGFELIEVLIVAHGRSHNDTIVTVERKFKYEMFKAA